MLREWNTIGRTCRMACCRAWLRCAPTLTLALHENIPSLKRYASHVATIAALRRGDGAAAAAAIRADIESARQDIGQMLREKAARE